MKNTISSIKNDSSIDLVNFFIKILNDEPLFSLSIIVLFKALAYNGFKNLNKNYKKIEPNLTIINGELTNVKNIFKYITYQTNSNIRTWIFRDNEIFEAEIQGSQMMEKKNIVDINLHYDEGKYYSLHGI